MFSDKAIIATTCERLLHFLLDIALVPFLIGPSSGKGDVFLFTIGYHDSIDGLSTVIGINPQNGKREQPTCALKGCQHRLLGAMQEGQAFRPAGGYIGERQRVQIAAIDVCATLGRPFRFQKSWLGLIRLLEGADRNLPLEHVPARVVERPRFVSLRWDRRRRSAVAALMESS